MRKVLLLGAAVLLLVPVVSYAQSDAPLPLGTPPPDATALVTAPTDTDTAPKFDPATHDTSVALSAGGLLSTGNSQSIAGTVNAKFDMRRGSDAFGASLLGNYGEGAAAGQNLQVTTENLQGRLRYDRYVAERLAFFLIGTGRHDRFQGLDFRLNVDPGLKYLFVNTDTTKFWGELGYDLQYDIRRDAARGILDANGMPEVDANGDPVPPLIDKTATDHSGRLFFGLKHAFNKEVNFSTGVEYLQSLVESTRYRVNYDALLAAAIGGHFSIGLGFTARYDHAPLPGKLNLDTATTVSLLFSYDDAAPAAAATCPCPAPLPPPPPPASSVPPPPPPPASTSASPPAPATMPSTTAPATIPMPPAATSAPETVPPAPSRAAPATIPTTP